MELLKKQPKALPFLFLTEMWERFGFYVVQGLLVLYMTQYFGFSDRESYEILGVFTALVYISPIVGGWIADRILGFKTAIVWGGLFLVLGYFLLALPAQYKLFYPGLAVIVVGNGLFKPNISSLLGMQYDDQESKREAGFTIFYIGINIGSFLAGLSSGYIKELFGWHASFVLASIGLIIGLVTFSFGLKHIKKDAQITPRDRKYKRHLFTACLLTAIVLTFILSATWLAQLILPIAGIFLLIFLTVLTVKQEAKHRKRLFVLNTLILSSVVFWALFFQLFFSASLFVDRLVEKNLFGIPLTTTVFYACEAIFVIILGPFFAMLWQSLGKRNQNPSALSKFILSIFVTGGGFLVLGISTFFPNEQGLVAPLWVFLAYLLITIGELLLSPIGLSAVTLLAPSHLVGMMMGIWFVATGFGGIFAGFLAKFASLSDHLQTNADKFAVYQQAFFDYAYLAFGIALLLLLLQWGFRKNRAASQA